MKKNKLKFLFIIFFIIILIGCSKRTKKYLRYASQKGGYIVGNTEQLIEKDIEYESVIAVPNEGYRFVKWSDGLTTPERKDYNIITETTFTAFFERIYSFKIIDYDKKAGIVEGDLNQIVAENELISEVEAIPNLGYKFICWSNGEIDNKLKISLKEDTSIYPIFQLEEFELPIMEINTEGSTEP